MKSVIISNGDILDFDYFKNIIKDKFVICCDGAISHCVKMGIKPDVWVGDKDSCILEDEEFKNATCNCEIIKLDPIKDMTDTEYAFDVAIQKGCSDITLIGAFGGRFDHTLANLYLIKKVSPVVQNVCIIDKNNVVFPAKKHNVINKGNFKYVSIIPLSDELSGVTTSGLYYKLSNETLKKYTSRGVSNEMTDNEAVIDITNGDAVIILSKD